MLNAMKNKHLKGGRSSLQEIAHFIKKTPAARVLIGLEAFGF